MRLFKNKKKIRFSFIYFCFFALSILFSQNEVQALDYNLSTTAGVLTSTNLLPAQNGEQTMNTIESLSYTVSSLPAGTTVGVQFSTNNLTWASATGVADTFTSLAEGTNEIDLSYWGKQSSFYYKIVFTSTNSDTPVLDSVSLNYTIAEAIYNLSTTAGVLTSTNLLPAQNGEQTMNTIESLSYTVSSLPAGTTVGVQFSTNNLTWANASGVVDAFTSLSIGSNNINLSYWGKQSSFYYKIVFTSTNANTPVLDSVSLNYTTGTAVYSISNSAGAFYSTNLLSAIGTSSIDSFTYTVSSLPSGTTLGIQFSVDNVNWYSSTGATSTFSSMSVGTNTIDLTNFGWIKGYFYYRVLFTSENSNTPVIDSVSLGYYQSYYWIGSAGGNWSDVSSWSNSSGGASGIGVPGATSSVIFDAGKVTNAVINTDITLAKIDIKNGYTGTVSQGASSEVNLDNFVQAGGTFVSSPEGVVINNNFTLTGGAFIASSSLNVGGDYEQTGASTFIRGLSTVNLTKTTGVQNLISTTTLPNNTYGLFGRWKFDEGTGTSVTDSAGYGNTATLHGSPTWSTATATVNFTNPYALTLNGSSQYVSLANPSALNISSPLTISTWIKTGSDSCSALFSLSDGSSAANNYTFIGVGNGCTSTMGNELVTLGKIVGGSLKYIIGYTTTSRTQLIDNNWHSLVVTYNGTTISLYLDGILKTFTTGLGNNDGKFGGLVTSSYAYIGAVNAGGVSDYMNAAIDDFRIYNRVLSASEILSLAQGNHVDDGGASFYNLTKTNPDTTINFAADNTVTVTGTTTLKGTAGHPLIIDSSEEETQWKFDPQGGLDLENLIVKNSNNVNASTTNINPNIDASNYLGLTDGGNNTNWTFIAPIINVTATGTQIATTSIPMVYSKYMGGAFALSRNVGTSTVTSIKVTQAGSLPVTNISNVQILYATSSDGLCSTSSTPVASVGAVEFGNSGNWSGTSTTIGGSVSVGSIPMCLYVRFKLSGSLNLNSLGSTIDLEISNPSTDMLSAGTAFLPSAPVNIEGIEKQTLVDGALDYRPIVSFSALRYSAASISGEATTTLYWNVIENGSPTTCQAAGAWSDTISALSGSKPISTSQFGNYLYHLVCSNAGGIATSSVGFNVYDSRIPTTYLSISPTVLSSFPSTATLTWSVSSLPDYLPTSCVAYEDWSGDKNISGGTESVNVTEYSVYRLRCINAYGTSTAAVTIGVPEVGGLSDATPDGSGTTPVIALDNADGTVTKFIVTNGRLYKNILNSNGDVISIQNLTAPGLTVTSAQFSKIGQRGVKINLSLKKISPAGSVSNFNVEKSFNTTAIIRRN